MVSRRSTYPHELALRDKSRSESLALGRRVEQYLRTMEAGAWVSQQELGDEMGVTALEVSHAVRGYYGVLESDSAKQYGDRRGRGVFVRLRPSVDPRVERPRRNYREMVDRLWELGVRDIRQKRKPRKDTDEN